MWCPIALVSLVSHRLKIVSKIVSDSNLSKFGALKVNKITRLQANFGVGHLNVAYMTVFFKIEF